MTTKKRFLAVSGLSIVLALALAACGGQEFPGSQSAPTVPTPKTTKGAPATSPVARLLAAAGKTTAARTARLAIDVSMSGLGGTGTVRFGGTGVMDLTNKRLSMTLQGAVNGESIDLEMRVIGNTAYVRTGSRWISETVASTGATTPVPTDYLDYLQGISGPVRTEGHETLRGVDTTRYGTTLDLDRALSRIGDAAQRSTVQHALDLFGLAKLPVTVWVDGRGRLRKMVLTLDLSAVAAKFGAPSGTHPRMVESIEIYDFGVPVSVQVPPNATKVTVGGAPSSSATAAPAHAIQSDLRNALTAEKVEFTDVQEYTASLPLLRQIESTLDWGGKLEVTVGNSSVGTADIVCLSERSGGAVYSIADIATGPRRGTYFRHTACPAATEAGVSAMDRSW